VGPSISLAIPTMGRDEVLVETIRRCIPLLEEGDDLVVVDQTLSHEASTEATLSAWAEHGAVRWLRQRRPSIPAAMNRALLSSEKEVVLFLDDDIEPAARLVQAHRAAHAAASAPVVAGQVLQPGEVPEDLDGLRFAFRSSRPQPITEVMGGNFSARRSFALDIGGFDENFVGAAYRFEAEFSHRVLAVGAPIWFQPGASIRHLRAPSGGTRSYGEHRTTLRPHHAVGHYYYLLRVRPPRWRRQVTSRLVNSGATRFHLGHPWWIPVTWTAEVAGLVWALRLASGGPKLLKSVERA